MLEKCYSVDKAGEPLFENGCVDGFPYQDREVCAGRGDLYKHIKGKGFIMCCTDNLCNDRTHQQIGVDIVGSSHPEIGESSFPLYFRRVSAR